MLNKVSAGHDHIEIPALVKLGAVFQDNADNPSKIRNVANVELYIFNLVCVRSALRERHELMQVFTLLVTSYLSK